MSSKFSDLITYFESLATKHVSIGHSDEEKHFFRMEVDEVLGGINRKGVAFPLLALEGYSYRFIDERADNIIKVRECGFMLLDHVSDISDYTAMHEKWDALEEIGDDILIKMRADKRNPLTPVIRDIDFSNIEVLLIKDDAIGNLIGFRYLFPMGSPVSSDVDETKWNEGGI